MKIAVQIPDEGLITSVTVDGREIVPDEPIKIKKGDRVIDLTGVPRQVEEHIERMGDADHRAFIETP